MVIELVTKTLSHNVTAYPYMIMLIMSSIITIILVSIISLSKTVSSTSSDRVPHSFYVSASFMNTFTRLQEEIERLNTMAPTKKDLLSIRYLRDDIWENDLKKKKEQRRKARLKLKNDSPSSPSLLIYDDYTEMKSNSKDEIEIHFCFLVHGYKGSSSDLAYLELALNNVCDSDDMSTLSRDNFIVHSVICNEGKTDDGIQNGGDRVVMEVMDVIHHKIKDCKKIKNITLSFVGNSLGGLYSRYAIAKIYDKFLVDGKNNIMQLNNGIQLHFNVFCSTASPHLGVADYTYITLPRSAEIGIGYAMRQTGKDL